MVNFCPLLGTECNSRCTECSEEPKTAPTRDAFSLLMQARDIIAEETGCPSLVDGIHREFKYCCDERGPSQPCYCEKAARKILATLKEGSSTHAKIEAKAPA